jgi:hypothetical protein
MLTQLGHMVAFWVIAVVSWECVIRPLLVDSDK